MVSPAISENSEEARAFLQRRVALFWKVIFGFGVMSIGVGAVERFSEPGGDFVINLLTTVQAGFLWWLSARGRRSIRFSRWIDAAGLFLNMLLGAFIGRFMMPGLAGRLPDVAASPAAEVMTDGFATMLLIGGMGIMVTIRAALIPSQPGRTAIVTAVAGLPPLLVSTFVVPTGARSLAWRALDSPAFSLIPASSVTMWAFTVAACAIISWVIFGLRAEVREARRLGQYVLERKLGEGGMGEVYLARHGMMRRPTAIKLLRAEQAGEASLLRFEREVQLTARLTHPNTITIFDYGRTRDGVFYYAMELLDGATLEHIVALTGPQPPSRVRRILRMACGALSEAHGTGLIHRDIKPANLMLCTRGGELDVLKVLDFGLVKELNVDRDVQLTGDNTVTGTPQYLAPESIRDPATVDARTDLYGLGAVAYFLLTGGPVFEGKTVVDVCAQHLSATPVPPSVRADGVSEDLEAVVLACLEKDPALRPQSADELRRRIDACAIDAWDPAQARAWWREHGPDLRDEAGAVAIRPQALAVDRRVETR